jgi:hypothetical protein
LACEARCQKHHFDLKSFSDAVIGIVFAPGKFQVSESSRKSQGKWANKKSQGKESFVRIGCCKKAGDL